MATKTQLIEELLGHNQDYDPKGKTKAALMADLELCEADDDAPKTMAATLRRYRDGYEPTTAYSGRKSLNNGDAIAAFLAGMSPANVLAAAERILGIEAGELAERYQSLNPGQQRMNGGNRLRAAMKRGDITTADLK